MPKAKEQKTLGKEKLERVIEMCIAIETRRTEPFTLNIEEIISTIISNMKIKPISIFRFDARGNLSVGKVSENAIK